MTNVECRTWKIDYIQIENVWDVLKAKRIFVELCGFCNSMDYITNYKQAPFNFVFSGRLHLKVIWPNSVITILQEILEEVRKELQKVKEEIIGGEITLYSLRNILNNILPQYTFFAVLNFYFLLSPFTAFIQELQKRNT